MTLDIQWGGLHTVISGGQTGADQGGLIGGWRAGVRTGGEAPWMYRTQDGYNPLLEILGLKYRYNGSYNSRTKMNIESSDGTVVIAYNMGSPGTVLTRKLLRIAEKPFLEININDIMEANRMSDMSAVDLAAVHGTKLKNFIVGHQIQILNVAGNREMKSDGTPGSTLFVTSTAEWIVGYALELLRLDGKLIPISES